MDKIQKQIDAPLKYQSQPQEFLNKVKTLLETMQHVYRMKLADTEIMLWKETLKNFSYQEILAAINELISNPPRYELEDGRIQVWRGMPKLPDVTQVMLENREKAYLERERRRKREEELELKKQEQYRKEHPEEFFGWKDLKEEFAKLQTTKDRNGVLVPGQVIPDKKEYISPILLGLDGGAREKELAEQKRIIESKHDSIDHK